MEEVTLVFHFASLYGEFKSTNLLLYNNSLMKVTKAGGRHPACAMMPILFLRPSKQSLASASGRAVSAVLGGHLLGSPFGKIPL